MKTSVIVPTRDRGEFVLRAVESALAARDVDEVVVADGGSTDGSLERLCALGDQVRVVQGDFANAAATRNAGAAAARGDLLAFLDSDDLMMRDKVTCLAPVLAADPSIAVAHGRTVVIDEHGSVDEAATREQTAQLTEGRRRGTSYGALAAYCAMYTSATLMRRDAFEAVGGYDESFDAYEDWDLYLRFSLTYRLVYADCPAARYRVWSGNVGWQRTAHWTARVAEHHLAAPPAAPSPESASARYAFLVRLATSRHVLVQRSEARRAALAAVREAPRRAFRDPAVRRPLVRSLIPAAALRRRRPS